MNKITLFVGDVDETVATLAKKHCKDAVLIDHKNFHILFDQKYNNITGYTSLGDLPDNVSILYQIFNSADDIFYCAKDTVWSDGKEVDFTYVTSSMQGLTEMLLFQINQLTNKVHNLDLSKYQSDIYTRLIDQRTSNSVQLWSVGGSIAAGVGVLPNERFGQILANQLKLSVSFLTVLGSSIEYQADQLLRSDIRNNDIIIWGITPEERIPFWSDKLNKVVHLNIRHRDHGHANNIDLLPSVIDALLVNRNCFYQSLIHIHQVVNFCNKINAKLLIVGQHISDTLAIHLNNIPNFVNYYHNQSKNQYIDLGFDDEHPGPKQHQIYADFCQEHLKKLNYI